MCSIPLFLWDISLGLIASKINRIVLKSVQGSKEKKIYRMFVLKTMSFKILSVKNKYLHHSRASGELIKECPFISECQEQFDLKMVLDG